MLLTEGATLPVEEALLRAVLVTGALADAGWGAVQEPLPLGVRVGVPQEDTVATPVRDPLEPTERVGGTEREAQPEELVEGLGAPFSVREKEGNAVTEGDTEAERLRLGLPVPLVEVRGVKEGQCVPPQESDATGLAESEKDTPAVRLGVGRAEGDALTPALREGEARLIPVVEWDTELLTDGGAELLWEGGGLEEGERAPEVVPEAQGQLLALGVAEAPRDTVADADEERHCVAVPEREGLPEPLRLPKPEPERLPEPQEEGDTEPDRDPEGNAVILRLMDGLGVPLGDAVEGLDLLKRPLAVNEPNAELDAEAQRVADTDTEGLRER